MDGIYFSSLGPSLLFCHNPDRDLLLHRKDLQRRRGLKDPRTPGRGPGRVLATSLGVLSSLSGRTGFSAREKDASPTPGHLEVTCPPSLKQGASQCGSQASLGIPRNWLANSISGATCGHAESGSPEMGLRRGVRVTSPAPAHPSPRTTPAERLPSLQDSWRRSENRNGPEKQTSQHPPGPHVL